MSKIFISYRRADSADVTGRMFDHLTLRFARDELFKDVDSIPLGTDFRKSISDAVQSCDVVLAVIGRDWLHSQDKQGNLRLSNPDDFVRIELEAGLERDIPVIPILVSGADMPEIEELPISLHPLVYRNSIRLRSDPDFSIDIQRLTRALIEILKKKSVAVRLLIALESGVLRFILLLKRTLKLFSSIALSFILQKRFITYIVIALMLCVVLIVGYLGYRGIPPDNCNSPNPPVSCLFK